LDQDPKSNEVKHNSQLGSWTGPKTLPSQLPAVGRQNKGRRDRKDNAMIKIRYFALPVLIIVFSSIRAIRSFSTEAMTNTADIGFDIFFVTCMTIGILAAAFTLKNKYWSGGVILAGLAYVARAAMMKLPDQKQILALTTLVLCAASASLLIIAWKTVDTAIAQRGSRQAGKAAYLYLIAVVIIVLGIFLYWGRG